MRQRFVLPSPPSIHPERKKNRLVDFDYSSPGYYFVTICTDGRVKCFGEVKDGLMVLNDIGKIVECFLKQIPLHYDNVVLDEFVVMPNHVHIIIVIENSDGVTIGTDGGVMSTGVGTEQCSVPTPVGITPVGVTPPVDRTPAVIAPSTVTPPTIPTVGLLSKIIKSFKEMCTKETKKVFGTQKFVWQRSFYDHIIRNENAYIKIKYYIQDNPAKWDRDRNNQPNLYM